MGSETIWRSPKSFQRLLLGVIRCRAGIAPAAKKASRTLETTTRIRIFPEVQRGDEALGRVFNS